MAIEIGLEVGAVVVGGVAYIASLGALFWRVKNIETNMASNNTELSQKVSEVDRDLRVTQIEAARNYATKDDIYRLEKKVDDLPQKVAELLKSAQQ